MARKVENITVELLGAKVKIRKHVLDDFRFLELAESVMEDETPSMRRIRELFDFVVVGGADALLNSISKVNDDYIPAGELIEQFFDVINGEEKN